jgi:hypothetical protein
VFFFARGRSPGLSLRRQFGGNAEKTIFCPLPPANGNSQLWRKVVRFGFMQETQACRPNRLTAELLSNVFPPKGGKEPIMFRTRIRLLASQGIVAATVILFAIPTQAQQANDPPVIWAVPNDHWVVEDAIYPYNAEGQQAAEMRVADISSRGLDATYFERNDSISGYLVKYRPKYLVFSRAFADRQARFHFVHERAVEGSIIFRHNKHNWQRWNSTDYVPFHDPLLGAPSADLLENQSDETRTAFSRMPPAAAGAGTDDGGE